MDAANRLNPTQAGSLPESSDTETAGNPEQPPQATQQPRYGVLERLSGAQVPPSTPRAIPVVRASDPSVSTPLSGQAPVDASHPRAVRSNSAAMPDTPPDAKAQLESFGFTPAQIEAMNRLDGALSMACAVWPTIDKRNKLAGNSHQLVARIASESGPTGLQELLRLAEHPLHQHYLAERAQQLGIGSPEDKRSWMQFAPGKGLA